MITEQKENETADVLRREREKLEKIRAGLEEALEKERETVKARDRFLSLATHELKTPLTTLLLQAQIKKRQLAKGQTQAFEEGKLKEMIESDLRQLGALNRLIDDMLDIARIRTGRLELKQERINLSETAKEVFEQYEPLVREKCHSFEFSVEENIFVEADSGRIVQVISNLLDSAMKNGQGKPLEAHVFCDPSIQKAFIVVSDNGIGKPKAISPIEVNGLGLGIAIVVEIVRAFGGEFLVDSEVGSGPTFTVRLPVIPMQ